MGTWAAGPFDNDTAADWSGDLEAAPAAGRPELVRAALAAVADEGGYLDVDEACAAVAAAAVIASQRPGGAAMVSTPYAPRFLQAGARFDLPPGLAGLARRALERVVGEDSEWLELWEDTDDGGAGARSQLATIEDLLRD